MVERVKLVHRGETLQPLPEAEAEVRTLGQLYGATQSKVYVGANASEEQAKSEAGQYQILHFATHGILNDRSPMYSHLLLAQSESQRVNRSMSQRDSRSLTHLPFDSLTQMEDGLLEAWEIMNLDLKAQLEPIRKTLVILSAAKNLVVEMLHAVQHDGFSDRLLVVLSACQTARGRVGAGEGVIGLTWAVFVAGCPATVVSQWKVPSHSTTELMLEFHRQLQSKIQNPKSKIGAAEALRQAMLKMLRRKDDYRQPFHWAGFVVVGRWRIVGAKHFECCSMNNTQNASPLQKRHIFRGGNRHGQHRHCGRWVYGDDSLLRDVGQRRGAQGEGREVGGDLHAGREEVGGRLVEHSGQLRSARRRQ
jgi:CHAT domain-containing protein